MNYVAAYHNNYAAELSKIESYFKAIDFILPSGNALSNLASNAHEPRNALADSNVIRQKNSPLQTSKSLEYLDRREMANSKVLSKITLEMLPSTNSQNFMGHFPPNSEASIFQPPHTSTMSALNSKSTGSSFLDITLVTNLTLKFWMK